MELLVDGEKSQLQAVGNAELVKDVVQVVLDGLLADEHALGDFLVFEALRNQLDDLLFPLTQRRGIDRKSTRLNSSH